MKSTTHGRYCVAESLYEIGRIRSEVSDGLGETMNKAAEENYSIKWERA